MTERQAWTILAEGVEAGWYTQGLCSALYAPELGLKFPARIRVKRRIRNALVRHRCDEAGRNVEGVYGWPLTFEGQKDRAAFCRRQVARLTRKRPAVPARKGKKR